VTSDSNLGVSGTIGLTSLEGSTVLVNIDVLAWKDSQQSPPVKVTGRGDTVDTFDSADVGGSGFVSGTVNTAGYPVPTSLRDQTGTLTLTFHFLNGVTKSIPIRITSAEHGRTRADKQPTLNVGWVQTGAATYAGFDGTQPGAGTPPSGDKQLREGTVWNKDPDGLQTSANVRWRARGLTTDTNAGEWGALATFIAAQTAPVAGLKLRGVTLERTDSQAGFYVATWGLTTTAEDFINANTRTTIDPSGLTSTATAAAINGTPSTPAGDNFVTVSTTTYELNDGNTATVVQYGLRTSHQGVEEDGTTTRADANDLEDGGTVTVETTSSTPPSTPSAPGSSTLVYVDTKPLNPGHYAHTFSYGPTNTQQAKEYAGTIARIDAQALDDGGTALVVTGSSTPPGTPTAPGTSKLIKTESQRLTSGGKYSHLFTFGPRDSADEIIFGGTYTNVDVAQVDTENVDVGIDTPPSPSGTYTWSTKTTTLKDGRTKYEVRSGTLSRLQQINFPHTYTKADTFRLDSKAQTSEIVSTGGAGTATAAPLTELQIIGTMRYPHRDSEERLEHVFEILDSKQQRIFPKTRDTYDGYAVDNEKLAPEIVATTATATAIATATSAAGSGIYTNYKYVGTIATPETPTNGTAAGQTLLVHRYAKADTSDRLTLQHARIDVDPNALDSTEIKAALWLLTDVEPSPPATPSGLVAAGTTYLQLPDDAYHKVIVYRFAKNDSKTSIERQATIAARNSTQYFERTTTDVLTCTAGATTVTLADAEWTAAMAATATSATIDDIKVRKLTATTYERTVITLASGAVLTINDAIGVWRSVPARLAGGFVEVYVPEVVDKGGTQQYCRIDSTPLLRVTATLRIRRRLRTDSAGIPVTNPAAAIGTTNNATLFGCVAGTLTFAGRQFEPNNLGMAAVHNVWVEDVLLYQSDGWFTTEGIAFGTQWGSFGATKGWNLASIFGAAWVAAGYTPADYSAFFA
jgi:hypothetical protein